MGQLRGTAAHVGKVGENLVEQVFAGLELGVLADHRNVAAPGHTDYLWIYEAPPPQLRCSCEIKNATRLHSQHDLRKFEVRLQEAVSCGRANCGLFLSLGCRVQGAKPFHLKLQSGVPVLWISRDADAQESAACVVAMAFRALSQLWPLLARQQAGEHGIEHILNR